MTKSRTWLIPVGILVVCGLVYAGWLATRPPALPEGFASSNGRIEATEIDIAAKIAGRLVEVLVREGDFVRAGQVLARMDTDVLEAQLREAQARRSESETRVEAMKSLVTQRRSEKAAAEATVTQREAELTRDNINVERANRLVQRSAMTAEELETYRAAYFGSKAAVETAKANVAAADAAIRSAESGVIAVEADVAAQQASIERIQADIDDSTLFSPRDGRVQYRVSEPGEVLDAGGRVLNLVDLGDVYMTFFLPTAAAGRVKIGTEVHLVLDAVPHLVIPATATFVADVAQFTPKAVETEEERQKLTFRVKARIEPDLLQKHIRDVKTGLPGMAYVRLDEQAPWPDNLQVRLPR